MPSTQTKQSASTVKGAKKSTAKSKDFQVIELVRRQGIYTGTLQISDVEEVKQILEGFDRNDGIQATVKSVTQIEFNAKGGRSGSRDYCLRLPNIAIEELEKIGFTKDDNMNQFYTSK